MRRPWYRKSTNTWYLELPGGRQVPLGKDERFTSPPKARPKEPPPSIQEKYLAAMQARAAPEDRKLSFCVERYMQSIDDCVESTQKRNRKFLERFCSEVGDPKVSHLKPHHLNDHIKRGRWKPNTVRCIIATVNACLNHCEREGWISGNPIRGKVKLPPIERREEIMSAADRKRLIDAATEPFKSALIFLEGTGVRPIEARAARVEKCDLERGVIRVPNKTRKKTGAGERPVFLSTAMIEHCRKLIGTRTEGWLLRNSLGEPWKKGTIQARMERLCDRLGIDKGARLYSTRHGFISEAINEKGINPALVAVQAGHSDLKMLMKTYLHADPEAMRRELDK